MSFLSILKTIGKTALGIEEIAAPILKTLIPAAAPILDIFSRLQVAITTAETNNPLDGQGVMKATAVVADFESGLGVTQEILSLEGKHLTWDDSALQAAISAQVAAYNAFAALKASFNIEDVPKTKT